MLSGGVFKLIILVGCAIVYTTAGGGHGKSVLLKFHVPEIVKHQHHTNVVFVHKHHYHPSSKKHHKHDHHHHHHHHGGHGKDHHKHHDGGKKAHLTDGSGEHYSHGFGDPSAYHHSHSYDHHDHYAYSHGHGDGLQGPPKTKPPTPHVHYHTRNPTVVGKKEHKAKPHHKPKKPDDKKKENLYDFEINYKNPLTGTQHYHYESYNPSYTFDNNKNEHESNHSVKHESLNVETNSYPGFENYKTPSSGNYEVNEPTFDIQTEHHKEDYGSFQQNSEYNDGEEEDKGLGSYAEDYTNPNSVAKYTSAIQHGTINLEDSNYNPDHGNDLEEYIKASQNSEEF